MLLHFLGTLFFSTGYVWKLWVFTTQCIEGKYWLYKSPLYSYGPASVPLG